MPQSNDSNSVWPGVFTLLFLFAVIGWGIWASLHGHWEETGNTIPAQDTFMFVKSGDTMVPIPMHYPAHPERRWVWDK